MISKELAVLEPYCENDMKLLKRISRSIFMRFNEQLAKADYDDFYSIANMTLWQAYNVYNPDMGISFDTFLRTCLKKKFSTEIQSRHRNKRIINQLSISLDASKDDEEYSLLEFVPSEFDTFEEVINKQKSGQYQDKIEQYLSKLSNLQVNILNLLIDGYKVKEIQEILEISPQKYTDELQIMRSYENVKILF